MKCPHCGQEHPDDFEFCPKTGKQIEINKESTSDFIACTNEECIDFGKKILPADSKFCPDCGHILRNISLGNNGISVNHTINFVPVSYRKGIQYYYGRNTCNRNIKLALEYFERALTEGYWDANVMIERCMSELGRDRQHIIDEFIDFGNIILGKTSINEAKQLGFVVGKSDVDNVLVVKKKGNPIFKCDKDSNIFKCAYIQSNIIMPPNLRKLGLNWNVKTCTERLKEIGFGSGYHPSGFSYNLGELEIIINCKYGLAQGTVMSSIEVKINQILNK